MNFTNRINLANSRAGAVVPFFAILLTLIVILIGFAVNLAHMQLVTTQLKIATDAASHAGGRALSIHQSTDLAIEQVEKTIRANQVDGKYLSVLEDGGDVNVVFGSSIRDNQGKELTVFHLSIGPLLIVAKSVRRVSESWGKSMFRCFLAGQRRLVMPPSADRLRHRLTETSPLSWIVQARCFILETKSSCTRCSICCTRQRRQSNYPDILCITTGKKRKKGRVKKSLGKIKAITAPKMRIRNGKFETYSIHAWCGGRAMRRG